MSAMSAIIEIHAGVESVLREWETRNCEAWECPIRVEFTQPVQGWVAKGGVCPPSTSCMGHSNPCPRNPVILSHNHRIKTIEGSVFLAIFAEQISKVENFVNEVSFTTVPKQEWKIEIKFHVDIHVSSLPYLVKQPLNIIGENLPLENLHTFLKQSLRQLSEHPMRSSKNSRLDGQEGVISRVRNLRVKSLYFVVLEK